MKKKIKIGVIGAGAIANNAHINNYQELPHVDVIAISDVNKERAEKTAQKFNIPHVYTDEMELLKRDDIDAVSICTPNHQHASQSIKAMEYGKHVLVEKPISISLKEADKMIKASEEAERLLMVGFTHRFFEHNMFVKQQLEKGVIGKPLNYRIRFAHRGPYESWNAKSDWFFDNQQAGGGALLDMGIHALDLLRYLGGEFKSIQGTLDTLVHDIEAEDFATAFVEFESGAYGQMETGWYSHDGFVGYEIYGSKGTIICDYETVRIYKEHEGDMVWMEYPSLGGGWDNEMEFFINAIKDNHLSHCTGADGKVSLKWALELYKGNND